MVYSTENRRLENYVKKTINHVFFGKLEIDKFCKKPWTYEKSCNFGKLKIGKWCTTQKYEKPCKFWKIEDWKIMYKYEKYIKPCNLGKLKIGNYVNKYGNMKIK